MDMPSLTPVPLAPAAVRGIAPLHGQVLPVLDLGVWLAAAGEARAEAPLYRAGHDQVLLVEATLPNETSMVRAALAVDRVTRLGTIDEAHARSAPAGTSFVAATVMDVDGPALLIDASKAFAQVRDTIRGAVSP
jgi:chemotaxis signal transduction protein